jgi:uncharacterized protein (TIGR02466 family)
MDECVQNVFSIKIFRKMICDPMVSNIQNEIKNIDNNNELNSYMMLARDQNMQTATNHPYMSDYTGKANFIKEHNLIHIETEILNNAKEYIDKTTNDNSFKNFRITSSQVIYFPPQFSGMPHAHIPGKLSGVYYFKTQNAAGNFRLISPIPYPYSYNGFATDTFHEITPTEGEMMIWPCWLMHEVLPNMSDEMRISISFQIEFDNI